MLQRTDALFFLIDHDYQHHTRGSGRHAMGQALTNRIVPIILIVDDVEETRDGIEGLLKADGYHVSAARHEEDAVEKARRERPGLILMSLGVAPNEVIAIARRIRQHAELSGDVPVVIFCSSGIAEGAEMGIGGNVYVTRPDNFDQLRAFVGRLLRTPTAMV